MALLFLPDSHIGKLVDRGRYFAGARALMRRGLPSACHANASMTFVETRGDIRIVSGYALSRDGLWRQHSWGVASEDGRVVETTVRRVRYYGFALDDAETMEFLAMNMLDGSFCPEEAKQVHGFIRGFFDEATVEQVWQERFGAWSESPTRPSTKTTKENLRRNGALDGSGSLANCLTVQDQAV